MLFAFHNLKPYTHGIYVRAKNINKKSDVDVITLSQQRTKKKYTHTHTEEIFEWK